MPLFLPVFFIFGIIFFFSFEEFSNSNFLLILLFLICAHVASLFYFKSLKFFLVLLFISIGFASVKIRIETLNTKFIQKEKAFYNLTGIIQNIEYKKNYTKLIIRQNSNAYLSLISRINNEDLLSAGDEILFSAVLKKPSAKVTPFGYDFSKIAYFKRIIAQGFVISKIKIIKKCKKTDFFIHLREKIHLNFQKNIKKPYSSVISALVTGKRDGIEETILKEFRSAGTSHLLAISGLHMGLISFICFILIRYLFLFSEKIALKYDIKKIAAFFAIIFSYCYLQIAGSPISAQRAFIIATLFFISIIFEKQPNSMRSIACAAFLILFFTPENIFHPGFQMSFIAVIGLCSFFNRRNIANYEKRSFINKILKNITNIMLSSAIVSVATMPFVIYHFNYFSLGGMVANLFAIPITTFAIMPFIVFTLILMPTKIAFGYKLLEVTCFLLLKINQIVAQFNFTEFNIKEFPPSALLIIVIGVLWFFILRSRVRFFAIIFICTGSLLAFNYKTPDILINEKYIAVKGLDSNLYYLNKGKARKNYVLNVWAKQNGQDSLLNYKDHKNNKYVSIERINESTFIYKKNGKKIFFDVINDEIPACKDCNFIFALKSFKKCKNCENYFNFYNLKKRNHFFYLKNDNINSVNY